MSVLQKPCAERAETAGCAELETYDGSTPDAKKLSVLSARCGANTFLQGVHQLTRLPCWHVLNRMATNESDLRTKMMLHWYHYMFSYYHVKL
jgi:hypothetical protein